MKNTLLSLFITAAVATTASAQTIWNGSVNSNITEAGNWDPTNLPTSAGNPGTINTGTVNLDADLVGYFVTQSTGSDVSASANRVLRDGSWTINAGTFAVTGTLGLQSTANTGNQSFSVTNGTASATSTTTVGSNNVRTAQLSVSGGSYTTANIIVNNGSTLNVSGGTFTTTATGSTSGVRVNAGSIMNISGGTLSVNTELRAATDQISFTGGNSTFSRLNANAGFGMTLGGTTAGSVTFTGVFGGTNHADANVNIDWLTGSKMSLTIGVADWASTLWADGRMTYNGQDFNALGNWATVTSTGGLGGGANFSYVGNTLSVIPEPTTWALLAVGMTAAVIFRRRRRA